MGLPLLPAGQKTGLAKSARNSKRNPAHASWSNQESQEGLVDHVEKLVSAEKKGRGTNEPLFQGKIPLYNLP